VSAPVEPDEEKPKERSALERITSLFKRSPAHDDFPRSEPYTGALVGLDRGAELQPGEALDTWVSAYHHGRSDEEQPAAVPVVPVVEEREKKPEPVTRKGYPTPGPAYDGPISDLGRRHEAEPLALTTHVAAYHSTGRSDDQTLVRAAEEEPVPEPHPPKETAIKRLTSIFTRAHPHGEFPHSEPYEGVLSELAPKSGLADELLDSHVAAYHPTGRSDQPAPEAVAAAPPAEAHAEKKGRLTALFAAKKVGSG